MHDCKIKAVVGLCDDKSVGPAVVGLCADKSVGPAVVGLCDDKKALACRPLLVFALTKALA